MGLILFAAAHQSFISEKREVSANTLRPVASHACGEQQNYHLSKTHCVPLVVVFGGFVCWFVFLASVSTSLSMVGSILSQQ